MKLGLIDAISLEKEMLEYARYVGRETTNECESTAESCADMVSGAPTIDPESLRPVAHWDMEEDAVGDLSSGLARIAKKALSCMTGHQWKMAINTARCAVQEWRMQQMTEKKISDYLPKTEILGHLTEELAEASAAASKLRRKIDGKNPTPKTLNECWEDLKKGNR